MKQKEVVAMLLAGGEGKRLGNLTTHVAKPAVPYGGKYRIIDFPLSNCTHSGIDTVGVLTQYEPLLLHSYIGIGAPWDLDRKYGGVHLLPPYMQKSGGRWYKGTANAIYENIQFIEQYEPQYVLILSGDHIYQMDYTKLLDHHKVSGADATISVREVPWDEAHRFGIMNTDHNGTVLEFEEKPVQPQNNLASMGVYIFSWPVLKQYLVDDEQKTGSSHDFGKDVIPQMLADQLKVSSYVFNGYWKDVGTIESLWEANMDLLQEEPPFSLKDRFWRLRSVNHSLSPQYIAPTGFVKGSMVSEGCNVYGTVEHSILSYGSVVEEGATVSHSVVMPNAVIQKGAQVHHAIVGEKAIVPMGAYIRGHHGEVMLYDDANPSTVFSVSSSL